MPVDPSNVAEVKTATAIIRLFILLPFCRPDGLCLKSAPLICEPSAKIGYVACENR